MASSRNWCFTLNNFVPDDEERLRILGGSGRVLYLVFGREQGVGGTPHLQGYVRFPHAKVFSTVKREISDRAHVEVARGSPLQASSYCKKEQDYEEFGDPPKGAGARTDLDRFKEWVVELGKRPSHEQLVRQFPGLWLRSGNRLWDIIDAYIPKPQLVADDSVLRDWQQALVEELSGELNDTRTIKFVVDPVGNTGKSFLCRYLVTKRDDVQILRIGKRDDLAHAIDASKSIFLIDVPRSQMEFLQYSVLEMLKDQTIFSPKYHSMTKTLLKPPFVVVFCNEDPDMEKLSMDRYDIRYV